MKISYVTNRGDLNTHGGYGIAGFNIVTSLQKLGHTIPFDDSTAPVQLNFCFPSVFADSLRSDQYQIWLAVFESTKLKPEWYDIVQEVDEVWCPSYKYAKILENDGIKVSKIYPHGLEPMWRPVKRQRLPQDKVRFLFEGGSARKNPQFVYEAFKTAFGDSTDVELIIKEKYQNVVREYSGQNIIGSPGGNVKIITKILEPDQMVNLFMMSDCLVGASAGEGFGLPPLQALGMGIPVIFTEEAVPYSNLLRGLGIKSTYGASPWPSMHPGEVLFPDFDDLVDKLKYVKENIDSLLPAFYRQAWQIHDQYDWLTLTEEAFKDIETKTK
jgi:hypothetical protein